VKIENEELPLKRITGNRWIHLAIFAFFWSVQAKKSFAEVAVLGSDLKELPDESRFWKRKQHFENVHRKS
jgi:hypothetical protein